MKESDVVFALTDTRESRWLPALLCRAENTPMINVALGFDSWLAMRHGLDPSRPVRGVLAPSSGASGALAASAPGGGEAGPPMPTMGCYFCSDVVGPLNTTRGRTMDQECTVRAVRLLRPARVCAPARLVLPA